MKLVPPGVAPETYFCEVLACASTFDERYGQNSLDETVAKLCDNLMSICYKSFKAFEQHEHYYASTGVFANGNLDFALDVDEDNQNPSQFKRRPVKIPNYLSSSQVRDVTDGQAQEEEETAPAAFIDKLKKCSVCHSPLFRPNIMGVTGCLHFNPNHTIKHGSLTHSSKPKFFGSLTIHLLTPSILMKELTDSARTVVLASGTLAPIRALAAELGLIGPPPADVKTRLDAKAEELKARQVRRATRAMRAISAAR